VTFRQSKEYLKLASREEPKETVEVVLNERQRQEIEYVKSHKHITISEFISLNKVSDKTARRDLNYLVEKGLFVEEGSTTGLKFRSTPVKKWGAMTTGRGTRYILVKQKANNGLMW
jgi:predicted HTH transcriptional regulator